jgi:hypothetical protein
VFAAAVEMLSERPIEATVGMSAGSGLPPATEWAHSPSEPMMIASTGRTGQSLSQGKGKDDDAKA